MTPQWGLDFAVTPGVYSDFNQASNKAFRLSAHAAAAWTWNEQAKIAFGVAYLDMPDTNFIPIGGLIWTPSKDLDFDLVFPTPKISRRVYWRGQYGDAGAGLGLHGGRVRQRRLGHQAKRRGQHPSLFRDYRFILGMERKVIGGLSSRLEVGYVFGRRVRYTNDTPDYYPADTVMVRGGLTY